MEEVIPFIIIMMIFSHYLFIYICVYIYIYIYTHTFFFGHMAFGILVPWAGIQPTPPVEETQSPNHWSGKSHRDRFKGLWKKVSGCFFSWRICYLLNGWSSHNQRERRNGLREKGWGGSEWGRLFPVLAQAWVQQTRPPQGSGVGREGHQGRCATLGSCRSVSVICDSPSLWKWMQKGGRGVCFQAAKNSQQVKLTQPRRSLIRA